MALAFAQKAVSRIFNELFPKFFIKEEGARWKSENLLKNNLI